MGVEQQPSRRAAAMPRPPQLLESSKTAEKMYKLDDHIAVAVAARPRPPPRPPARTRAPP